jgi:hypothetical protein
VPLRAKAELPGSIEMLLMLAHHYTDTVLAGHNKATLPAVEAPTLNLAFCDSLTNATLIEEAEHSQRVV